MPNCVNPAPRRLGSVIATASLVALLSAASPAGAQALVKVNDTVNFKLGILLQPQADWQETIKTKGDGSAGFYQNLLVRRLRFLLGGQVAKNVFLFFETDNSNLGKSTQAVGSTSGVKSPGTGFSLIDAVGEWRIDKAFNIQFGEIRSPISREGLKSSPTEFMLDLSAYTFLTSSPCRTTRAATRASCSAVTSSAIASSTVPRSSAASAHPASTTRRAS